MNSNVASQVRTLLSQALPKWRGSLGAVVAGALVLWFSVPTLKSLHSIWLANVDYSHGHLVFAMVVGLVIRDLRLGRSVSVVTSWAGCLCLLVLMLAVVVAQASTTLIIAQMVLPALWIAAIWALAGPKNARRFALPIAYLYSAIPIWSLFIEPMLNLTVLVVSSWIRAAGLPAFIEGNFIHVPTGTFEVQGGCAGLRYTLVAVALAVFSSLLHRLRLAPAMVLTVSAFVLALVGNWLRVFITVAAGLSPDAQILQMVHSYHTLFGWILFVVFMVPLFYLDRMVRSRVSPPPAADVTVTVGTYAAHRRLTPYLACAVLVPAIWLTQHIEEIEESSAVGRLNTVLLPAPEIAGWDRTGTWEDARLPVFLGASAQLAAWYSSGPERIGVYLAHYANQSQEREVVRNRPGGQFGVIVADRTADTTAASGFTQPFRELEVVGPGEERRLIWVGFRVAGSPTASELVAKILQANGVIRGRRDAQALVLSVHCDGDCSEAGSSLSRYATVAAEPLFQHSEQFVSAREGHHVDSAD